MLAERSVERPLCFFFFFFFFFFFGEHASIDLLVLHGKDFRKKPFSEIRSLAKAVELCDSRPCPCSFQSCFLVTSSTMKALAIVLLVAVAFQAVVLLTMAFQPGHRLACWLLLARPCWLLRPPSAPSRLSSSGHDDFFWEEKMKPSGRRLCVQLRSEYTAPRPDDFSLKTFFYSNEVFPPGAPVFFFVNFFFGDLLDDIFAFHC